MIKRPLFVRCPQKDVFWGAAVDDVGVDEVFSGEVSFEVVIKGSRYDTIPRLTRTTVEGPTALRLVSVESLSDNEDVEFPSPIRPRKAFPRFL